MNSSQYINKLLEIADYREKKNISVRSQKYDNAAHFRDLEKIASEELDTLALEFNFADDSIENKIYEYVMSDYCSPSELTPLIRNYKIKLLIDDKLE